MNSKKNYKERIDALTKMIQNFKTIGRDQKAKEMQARLDVYLNKNRKQPNFEDDN